MQASLEDSMEILEILQQGTQVSQIFFISEWT